MIFPVAHSVLSCRALHDLVLKNYAISQLKKIDYFQAGLTDTYLVITNTKKYILRIYRTNWRSEKDIRCEMDALIFLNKKNILVATPVTTKTNEILIKIDAPEGLRYLILFNYADGTSPDYRNKPAQHATIYGQAFGKLHNTLVDFNSTHTRFKLDINYLLNEPLNTIKTFLKDKPQDWQAINQIADKLKHQFYTYSDKTLKRGFCHGDLNTGNVHINNNQVTFFDFDCCGFGYHAADIAIFLWGAKINNIENKIWQPFLEAYLKENPLKEADLHSISIFASMRHIWHIGLHLYLSKDKGSYWINDHYFSKQIKLLENWQKHE